MDLLADYAIGNPEAGIPADDRLLVMLDEFANAPTDEIDVSEMVKPVVEPVNPEGEQPAQNSAPAAEPAPAVEPKPAENEKAPEEAKHHPTPEARPQETVPNKVTKSVLEALLRL